jgi:hypothetical protein
MATTEKYSFFCSIGLARTCVLVLGSGTGLSAANGTG